VDVRDDWRWLENIESPEVVQWIQAQDERTRHHLEQLPLRKPILDRLMDLWSGERWLLPRKRGAWHFFERGDHGQAFLDVYRSHEPLGQGECVLDRNELYKTEGLACSEWEASPDGSLIAYSLSEKGSDWREWRIRDIAAGRDLDDRIVGVKALSVSWDRDGSGFCQCRLEPPLDGSRLVHPARTTGVTHHRLGANQNEDQVVFARSDDREWVYTCEATSDRHYLIISTSRGTAREVEVFAKDLANPWAAAVELFLGAPGRYSYVGSHGGLAFFLTDHAAGRRRLVVVDLRGPQAGDVTEILPELGDVLCDARIVGDHLIALFLHNAYHRMLIFDLEGRFEGEVRLPGRGTVELGEAAPDDDCLLFSYTDFLTPRICFRLEAAALDPTAIARCSIPFVADGYATEQVFCTSRDGTRVSMFLSGSRGALKCRPSPVFLYGYGRGGHSLTPMMYTWMVPWLERGGVCAVVNVRGGGEYGRDWHQAAMKQHKQRSVDDFVAAAEWLVATGRTSNDLLSAAGWSGGGTLVGAAVVQRPDLFAACVVGAGVLDLIRFSRFTVGRAWLTEFGSPDDPEEFAALLKLSPCHNIRPGVRYPATIILTGDHDDRVFPGHSYKFSAALQAAQAGDAPILLRVEHGAGHGPGVPLTKGLAPIGDALAFLAHAVGMGGAYAHGDDPPIS
jgi:prolyl oligopeptidase